MCNDVIAVPRQEQYKYGTTGWFHPHQGVTDWRKFWSIQSCRLWLVQVFSMQIEAPPGIWCGAISFFITPALSGNQLTHHSRHSTYRSRFVTKVQGEQVCLHKGATGRRFGSFMSTDKKKDGISLKSVYCSCPRLQCFFTKERMVSSIFADKSHSMYRLIHLVSF